VRWDQSQPGKSQDMFPRAVEVLGCYARINEVLLLKLGGWAAGAYGIGMPCRW